MKTRVAKIVAEEKIELFEEEIPALKDDEVLVKVEAVGICGSDLHFFRHCGLGSFKEPLPLNIGHEGAGIVVDGKPIPTGTKVAIEPGLNCGECHYCHRGLFNLCTRTRFLGANDQGAFRDYLVVTPKQLMPIGDHCSYERAALLEPVGVALHAVNLVHCKLDDWVAVLGSGTIGLCLLVVLKKLGCNVTMLDPLQYRLDFAKSIGANETFLNDQHLNLQLLKNRYNVVFDAVGTQDSLDKCVRLAAPSSEICVIGIPEVDLLTINPHQMRIKELTLKSSRRSNQQLEKAYSIFNSDIIIDEMVTHRFELQDIQKAFEISSNYADGVIKTMIIGTPALQ